MNNFKETFSQYTSDHLLEKRALGDGLAIEAHLAIEEIFAERCEFLPPRPIKPVNLKLNSQPKNSKFSKTIQIIGALLVMVFATTIAKLTPIPWGFVITGAVICYFLIYWIRKNNLTKEQATKEEEDKKAEEEGILELMLVSANGDLVRVIELLNFGADVNVRSNNNSTALMFAARNNYLDIVKLLVKNGADINAKNDKGSTAISIANAYGHQSVVEYLNALKAFKT